MDTKSVTAVDYLEEQLELEREAREVMPYDPDVCTYPRVLRQLVFACLTCLRQSKGANVGVCYLCLIQCHSTHELVELFTKRDFACDCGTTRMHEGSSCALRAKVARAGSAITATASQTVSSTTDIHSTSGSPVKIPRLRTGSISESLSFSTLDLPKAEDIPSLDNTYNHNFQGKFCSCDMMYNPVQETRTMHQCYLGDVCGEDWYHQDCILGYKPGIFKKTFESSGENKLDLLPPPGLEASADPPLTNPPVDEDTDDIIPHFPDSETFGEFVCWKCVSAHQAAFDELKEHSKVVAHHLPHFREVQSAEKWKDLYDQFLSDEPPAKKVKSEGENGKTFYSVFLAEEFKSELGKVRSTLPADSPLEKFLNKFEFFAGEDPIHQPPKEELASSTSSTGSLYELGSNALLSLPAPQAIEGLHAYGVMKAKLRDFFQNFVEQDKVVTEDEVRAFFGNMKSEKD